jgi:hypothetical protein
MTRQDTIQVADKVVYFWMKLTPRVRGQKAPSTYKTVRTSR